MLILAPLLFVSKTICKAYVFFKYLKNICTKSKTRHFWLCCSWVDFENIKGAHVFFQIFKKMYLPPSLCSRFNTENIWDDFESLIKTCVYQIFEEYIYSFYSYFITGNT